MSLEYGSDTLARVWVSHARVPGRVVDDADTDPGVCASVE